MKIVPQSHSDSSKIEIRSKKDQIINLKYQGSLRMHKNHTMFKVNLSTLEISIVEESEYNKEDTLSLKAAIRGSKNNYTRKSLIAKSGYFYVSALNINNAKKKLTKIGIIN